MERFRVTPSYSVSLQQRPTFPTHDSMPHPHRPREPHFASHLRPLSASEDHRLRRLTEDTELSIFDAERYFNEGEDLTEAVRGTKKGPVLGRADAPAKPRASSVSSLDGGRRSCQNGSVYATPTASSEASWNSRSGLLSNPPGSVAISVRAFPLSDQRKGSSSACRWLFRRSCPCSGRGAVNVQDKYSSPMSPSHSTLDSMMSAGENKKDPKGGEACDGEVAAAADGAVALKELDMVSGVEMRKIKLVSGTWVREQDLFRDSSNSLSPGNHFPEGTVRRRIVNSGMAFKDGSAFSFPVLNEPIKGPGKLASSPNQQDEPPRHSLEVFRPAEDVTVPRKSADFQRRAGMPLHPPLFTGDVGPRRSFTFPSSPRTRVAEGEDDLASDSSSDLFEIESLSTQMASCPTSGRRRDSLDELLGGRDSRRLQLCRSREEPATPLVAPSECYAPSEVSVEWSVITAEGGFGPGSVANFSSAASDYDDAGFVEPDHRHTFPAVVAGGGKHRSGGLLSCRCEKAVSVGPHPVRFDAEQQHQQFPAEAGRIRVTARAGKGSSAAAHLSKAAGAPPLRLALSHDDRVPRPPPGR